MLIVAMGEKSNAIWQINIELVDGVTTRISVRQLGLPIDKERPPTKAYAKGVAPLKASFRK